MKPVTRKEVKNVLNAIRRKKREREILHQAMESLFAEPYDASEPDVRADSLCKFYKSLNPAIGSAIKACLWLSTFYFFIYFIVFGKKFRR